MSQLRAVKGQQPPPTAGMRHVALFVSDFKAACFFYIDLLGMAVEWQPDEDNIFLCSGNDNVALHNKPDNVKLDAAYQQLDHIGFILDVPEQVDQWHAFLMANEIRMLSEPRTHRDGARSFYCKDPVGTVVQMIYHPPISAGVQ